MPLSAWRLLRHLDAECGACGTHHDADTGWRQALVVPDHFDNFGAGKTTTLALPLWSGTTCAGHQQPVTLILCDRLRTKPCSLPSRFSQRCERGKDWEASQTVSSAWLGHIQRVDNLYVSPFLAIHQLMASLKHGFAGTASLKKKQNKLSKPLL